MLGYMCHPRFPLHVVDLTKNHLSPYLDGVDAVVHLPAIVGFSACQAVGRQVAWCYNVDLTQEVLEDVSAAGVKHVVFASTYSNYGTAKDNKPVTEDSQLNPHSISAETKIASERHRNVHFIVQ